MRIVVIGRILIVTVLIMMLLLNTRLMMMMLRMMRRIYDVVDDGGRGLNSVLYTFWYTMTPYEGESVHFFGL